MSTREPGVDPNRLMAFLLLVLAGLIAVMLSGPARADGSGRGTIYKATASGGSPATYTLLVSDTSAMAVGDHLVAYTATSSGVWLVTSITNATTVVVRDSLTEEHGSAFGAPSATGPRNVYGFATPGDNGLTRVPDSSVAYAAAALRRNAFMTVGIADISTAVAGCIAVFNGDRWTLLTPGANGTTLTADSTAPGGLKWQ